MPLKNCTVGQGVELTLGFIDQAALDAQSPWLARVLVQWRVVVLGVEEYFLIAAVSVAIEIHPASSLRISNRKFRDMPVGSSLYASDLSLIVHPGLVGTPIDMLPAWVRVAFRPRRFRRVRRPIAWKMRITRRIAEVGVGIEVKRHVARTAT